MNTNSTGWWGKPPRAMSLHYFPGDGQASSCGKWEEAPAPKPTDKPSARCRQCKA